jgi:tetratricopeptide (TPR) repeat protein
MSKRKRIPLKGILIGLWALALCLSIGYRFHPTILPEFKPQDLQLVQRDLPITTEEVSFKDNKYGNYLVGILAQQKQDYDQTNTAFTQALAIDKNNAKLKQTVYLLKAVRGEMTDAIPLAQDLNDQTTPELLTDYILIADAIKNKDYQKAILLLHAKPIYGPDNILKPVLFAWVLAGQGKRTEAEKELSKLENENMDSLLAYYRALLALHFNDKKTAKKQFQKMSSLSQNGYPSLTSLVILHDFYQEEGLWTAGNKDYDHFRIILNNTPAVRDVLQGLTAPKKITPEIGSAIAFYDISVALAPLKAIETSLIFNEISLYLYPEALTPKIWGGELMEQSGNYKAANRIYDRIQNPTYLIQFKKAMNLIALDQHEKALPILSQLQTERPLDAYVHLLLGDSYAEIQNIESAAQSYQTAGDLFKKNNTRDEASQTFLALGALYDQDQKRPEAETAFLEAIRLNPNNAIALNYLGYLWLDSNKNTDEAFQMVQKAAELEPNDPNIMDSLAWGHYIKKDYKKALEIAEKSIDMLSFSSVAYDHLGDIYTALNRHREARYQYRKALDLTADITPELKARLEEKLNR